ncbi:MAG: hypothetical protein KDI44_15505 [Thiothrix sp.]|nr:hypothetical protein [Thiothrix sp.]
MANKKNHDKAAVAGDPYLAGRRAWNEQFGGHIAAAKAWRALGLVSLLLAGVCAGGMIWFAGSPKLLPYVVEVDREGEIAGVFAAGQMKDAGVEKRVIQYQLAQFVQGVRGVSPDVNVQREAIERVYALLSQAYPAYQAVSEWYRGNSPLKRAGEETVAVEITQLLPLSEKTWRIEWREKRRARNGNPLGDARMTGTLTVLSGGTVTEKNLLRNPTGLYVTHFDWQEQLGR